MWIQYIQILLWHIAVSLLQTFMSHKITMCWVMERSMILGFSIAQTTVLCTFTCTQDMKTKVKFSSACNNGMCREEQLYCTYF